MKLYSNKKNEQTTNQWSGGETTELYIFPDGATYMNRDFAFRISTATITASESTFTPLPDFKRHIMVLDGQLTLTYNESETITLNPFETDEFEGGWDTVSEGIATDFNLMLSENFEGYIDHFDLPVEHALVLTSEFTYEFKCLYLISGKIQINGKQIFEKQDFFVLSAIENGEEIEIKALEKSKLIEVNVRKVVI